MSVVKYSPSLHALSGLGGHAGGDDLVITTGGRSSESDPAGGCLRMRRGIGFDFLERRRIAAVDYSETAAEEA